jgi:hypothetical protein
MTNSKQNFSSEKILDTIMDLLSEERVAREIDEPIEMAAERFQEEVKVPLSHSDYNRVITKFARGIYEQGLRLSRHLSDREALTEAVSLLEKYYQGIDTRGYDEALVEATGNNIEGLEYVLSMLKESIKAVERKKYVQWVFADTVDPLDWEAHRRLAETYMRRYREFLPHEFRNMDPARFAGHFQSLIKNHL